MSLSEKLFTYYEDHPDDFADDLEALNELSNCLGDERRRPMSELDDRFGHKSVAELLALGGHSRDEDDGPFDLSRDYFYVKSGDPVSTDYRDYRADYLDDGTVARIIDNAAHLHLSHGAQMIIDESKKLLNFYKNHPDDFADDIEQLDDFNGYLRDIGNGRRHLMGELDDLLNGYSPTDMMALAFYSWDEPGRAPFDPGRNYFYWNNHAGLVSTNDRDYRPDYLSDGTVEEIVNNAVHLHLSKGAQEIINGHND